MNILLSKLLLSHIGFVCTAATGARAEGGPSTAAHLARRGLALFRMLAPSQNWLCFAKAILSVPFVITLSLCGTCRLIAARPNWVRFARLPRRRQPSPPAPASACPRPGGPNWVCLHQPVSHPRSGPGWSVPPNFFPLSAQLALFVPRPQEGQASRERESGEVRPRPPVSLAQNWLCLSAHLPTAYCPLTTDYRLLPFGFVSHEPFPRRCGGDGTRTQPSPAWAENNLSTAKV